MNVAIDHSHPDDHPPDHREQDRALADRALDGLRRHQTMYGGSCCITCDYPVVMDWPCPDALDWWAVLTAIGATYGVTQ